MTAMFLHRTHRRCRKLALCAAIALSTLATGGVMAGNADIDTTYVFGGGFLRELGPYTTRGTSGALQPDGKLLLVGVPYDANGYSDFGIARHLAEGEPDFSFGAGTSQTVFDLFNQNNEATEVAYSSAGIYLAGYSFNGAFAYMTVARLTHAGALDTSFGINGKVSIQMGTWSMINGIAVQRDGKIVLVGVSEDPTTKQDYVVVRLNTDGSTDSSFGLGGKVRIPLSTNDNDSAHGVVVRDDGSILVVGETRIGSQFSTDVICLNQYGDLNPAFGIDGIARLARTGYNLYGRAIALDMEGKAVVASNALQFSPYLRGINMTRLNANGTLDTSYNGGVGHVFTPLAAQAVYDLNAMEVLPTGQALAVGQIMIHNGDTTSIFSARFNEGGMLDPAYNNGVGYKLGDVGGTIANQAMAEFVSILPNGRFYVGGHAQSKIFALRYQGDPLDLVPNQLSYIPYINVARSTVQTSQQMYVNGLSPGARVPVTVSGGMYSVNGGPATSAPGLVDNGDSIRLTHTSSASYSTTATTTLYIGGLTPANNRGNIIGDRMVASFESTTAPLPAGGGGGGGGGGHEP